MDEFAYFMVRLHRQPATTDLRSLAGMVERLATGEKCSFTSGDELLRLMDDWPASRPATEKAGPRLTTNPGR